MTRNDSSTLERGVTNAPRIVGRRTSGRLVYSSRRGVVDPHFRRLSRYMTFYYPIKESDYSAVQN